jgi:hypothetical protein
VYSRNSFQTFVQDFKRKTEGWTPEKIMLLVDETQLDEQDKTTTLTESKESEAVDVNAEKTDTIID